MSSKFLNPQLQIHPPFLRTFLLLIESKDENILLEYSLHSFFFLSDLGIGVHYSNKIIPYLYNSYFYFWNILFADLHQIFSRGQIPKEMYQEIANLVSFKILRSLFLYYLKNFLNIYLRFYTLIYQCLVF